MGYFTVTSLHTETTSFVYSLNDVYRTCTDKESHMSVGQQQDFGAMIFKGFAVICSNFFGNVMRSTCHIYNANLRRPK